MTKRTAEILKRLDETYGTEYICYLNHETPWQLLIAVILSAQCTDARVNIVTETLFKKYDTLEKFANADLAELEEDIRSTGFYHNKAKNIISCARTLVQKYHGEVPSTLEELTSLAGVGRKTANVVISEGFQVPAIAVDTHVERISKRLGFAKKDDTVNDVERKVCRSIPRDRWNKAHHQFIFFGRYFCKAQNPNCKECHLYDMCKDKIKEVRK